jgi:hypothetical protein
MRYSQYLLLLLIFLLSSCGADILKANSTVSQTSKQTQKECSFTSNGPAVCGVNGKNYLNKQHAECFTTVKNIGACECGPNTIICGSDGVNHYECDAIDNKFYTIVKTSPCHAVEL